MTTGVLSIYIKPNGKIIFKITKWSNYVCVGSQNCYHHKLIYRAKIRNGILFDVIKNGGFYV